MGKKLWFFPHFFVIGKCLIKFNIILNNLMISLQIEKNEYFFLQIIENYLSTSGIFFQDLLGNKPWLFPHLDSLEMLDLQGNGM